MIYLDNSATTFPKPESVIAAIKNCISRYSANPGRGGHRLSLKASQAVYDARTKVKEFFDLPAVENVVFTPGCTYSLNMVIKGVLKQGDHVIISSLEHNSVLRPVRSLSERGVITYSVAKVYPSDDDSTLMSFRNCINERTKLIICTHASNVFGFLLPAERICALAHQYNILFCLDAAQSAGVIPIDMMNDGYDFVCCAGHKGLYGIMGVGMTLINSSYPLSTIIEGGTGSESENPLQPEFYPDRFESGTLNLPGICSVAAGIDYVSSKQPKAIFEKETRQINMVYDAFANIKKVRLYTDKPDVGVSAPVLSFNVEGKSCEKTAAYLDKNFSVATRAGLHCAPLAHMSMGTIDSGTVRISPSAFTTDAQINTLIRGVYQFCKTT